MDGISCQQDKDSWVDVGVTDVFLLLMHMANLEPDILLAQRSWWVGNNVPEAL
jgi:hypothetical protein